MPYHKAESAEAYAKTHPKWAKELTILRDILVATEMEETLKWSMPTYTVGGKNVIGLAGFKNHFCLWFHQGAFLSDSDKVLVNAQEGKTKAMRHMRFESAKDIKKRTVKKYVLEAIENQKAGKEIKAAKPTKKTLGKMPIELEVKLKSSKVLNEKFQALSAARRKDYAEYISSAKRGDTKKKRMGQIVPMIKAGRPLSDLWK